MPAAQSNIEHTHTQILCVWETENERGGGGIMYSY